MGREVGERDGSLTRRIELRSIVAVRWWTEYGEDGMAQVQPSNQPYYPRVKLTFQVVVYGVVTLLAVKFAAAGITDIAHRLGL